MFCEPRAQSHMGGRGKAESSPGKRKSKGKETTVEEVKGQSKAQGGLASMQVARP